MAKFWGTNVRHLLSVGLFDQQSQNEDIIDILADGITPASGRARVITQSEDAFTIPVSKYIEESKVVGALEGLVKEGDDILDLLEPSTPGLLTVIEGMPEVSLLHDIGKKLNVRPEHMLEHLKFSRSFRIRPLPSRITNCITVKFITLGSIISRQPPVRDTITDRSQGLAYKMETHHEEYLKSERVGVDFFREANIHDSGFISVEQHATFFPYYESTDSQGWSGILLMDLGRINAAPP